MNDGARDESERSGDSRDATRDGLPTGRERTRSNETADRRSLLRSELTRIRSTPRWRFLATGLGAVVGLVLAMSHWYGLIVGGALVGLPAQTLPRAVLTALGFGIVVLGVFLLSLASAGLAGAAIDTGLPFGVSAAIAIGCAVLGALVRGVF